MKLKVLKELNRWANVDLWDLRLRGVEVVSHKFMQGELEILFDYQQVFISFLNRLNTYG